MFKPMLATDANLETLDFPLYASPKLDGIRAVVRDGVVYSRSNKPIPNKIVQLRFSHLEFFDGELIVGDPRSKSVYRDTVSIVMSNDKVDEDIRFYAFDSIREMKKGFESRYTWLEQAVERAKTGQVFLHEQQPIASLPELYGYEDDCLNEGYEGLILRNMDAPYKCGRSTAKEGFLLKMKRFVDAEFVVIGFEERMHNGNEATTNELGRTARSSHKAGKTGRGDLGALVLRTPEGVEFNCGTGFTDEERADIWKRRDHFLGALAKVKYFPVGVKIAPRHPVFLGWRAKGDM